ncbi:hypothetical protein [Niemeyer virus]|nr:hypothetical protein [Niemeyer virus]
MDNIQNLCTNPLIILIGTYMSIKYYLFQIDYFNIQFGLYVTFIISLLYGSVRFNSLQQKKLMDGLIFILHVLFVLICFSIKSEIISGTLNTIFYFGFVKTIIISVVIGSFILSELDNNNHNRIIPEKMCCFCKQNIKKIMVTFVKNIDIDPIIYWSKTFFVKLYTEFKNINSVLSKNTRSEIIIDRICLKISLIKMYLYSVIVPYAISSFFGMNNDYKNIINNIDKIDYPGNLDMSFLEQEVFDSEHLDDLDDLDTPDTLNVPISTNNTDNLNSVKTNQQFNTPVAKSNTKSNRRKKTGKKIRLANQTTSSNSSNNQSPESTGTNNNVVDNKTLLRNKLREKRLARTGSLPTVPQNVDMSMINSLMQNMINNGSLKKLATEFAKNPENVADINNPKLRKLAKSMTK